MSGRLSAKRLPTTASGSFALTWSFAISVSSDVGLSSGLEVEDGLSLLHHVLVLDTHEATTVHLVEGNVVVEVGHEGLLEGVEVLEVLLLDVGQGNAGGGLEVDELSEVGFTFDDAEGDTLLSAEGWKEAHELNWLDIGSDGDELGLAFFNEGGNMVESELKMNWLWSDVLGLVASLSSLSLRLESVLLDGLGLWLVLVEELEELSLLVLLDSLGEDVEDWWALESHEKHSLLSLDSHILWPLHISGQVSLWLDVTTDSHVSWGLLEKGGGSSGLLSGSGGDDLLSFGGWFLWHL